MSFRDKLNLDKTKTMKIRKALIAKPVLALLGHVGTPHSPVLQSNALRRLCACVCSLVFSGSWVCASTVLIDLGNNTQTTTGNWNDFTAGTGGNPTNLTGLVDTDGNTTTIDLAYAENFGTAAGIAGTGANYDGAYPAALVGIPQSALRDGMFVQQNGRATLTFSGLNPSLTYNWTFYGARGNNGGGATYELTGANSGTATISNVFNNSTEVATFTGISPTAGGIITLEVTQSNPPDQASLNFLQIDAVPEPTTIALCGLGLLGLLRRRR